MSFFATSLGTKVGAGLSALATVGGFCAAWLPHTVYLDKYEDIVHFYRHGFKLKLDEEIQNRAESVLRDVRLGDNLKKSIRFFHVATLESFFAGTPESGYGAIVGIPTTFTYKTVGDVPVNEIAVLRNTKSIDWESPAGKLLKESFVFSEEAQKYAIAQYIYLTNTNHVTVGSVTAAGAVLNVYIFSRLFNRKLPGMPLLARSVVYGITAAMCSIGYIYIKDMTTYNYERETMEKAINLGPEYARGAVEYYQKNIVRNKALRVILGKEGASMYTVRGNLNTIIRTPHMPLNACLDRSKELCKKNYLRDEVKHSLNDNEMTRKINP